MKSAKQLGFTLMELMVVVVIVGILTAIAVPSYSSHRTKASRQSAQAELIQLAAIQEKTYLNSNSYSSSVAALGSTGSTQDGRYTIDCPAASCVTNSFTLSATPVAGSTQANDGVLTIDSTGQRLWNGVAW